MYNNTSYLTLTGKKASSNLISLGGKNVQPVVPTFVSNIQVNIMNNIIPPLVNCQWNTVQQNLFLVDLLMPKISLYYTIYKLPELLVYKNILTIYRNVLNEHIQLADLEKQFYGSTLNNTTNIVYKTVMVSLKAEYSLYNMIVGVPKFASGETYRSDIIAEIQVMLGVPNIDYALIKADINQKFAIK